MGEIVEFNSEWLSLTSVRNEGNVGYIRERTHTLDALRFWVRQICGVKVSWILSVLPRLPTQTLSYL